MSAEKKKSLVEYWLRGSQEDLLTSKEIFKGTTRFTSALYFGHLAVEKKLKAAFVQKFGTHAPYTHNLIHLVARLEWEIEDDLKRSLQEVNEFNLEGRYPDQKYSFLAKATESFCAEKIEIIEKALLWISLKSNTDAPL